MSEPLVSVVMPVFNGADLLSDAVTSVRRQAAVELEILIHDDGSTDGTPALLVELAAEDGRVRVTRGANRGPAASRNAALREGRGEYVAFLDHDDLWPESRLARQLRRLESEPGTPGMLGESLLFEALGPDGTPLTTPRSRRVLAGLLQAGLFRRSAVDAAGPFDPSLAAADDFDFLLRLIEAGPLLIEREVAVFYRLHPGQHTADLEATGRQTARALARSLARRRERS